MDDDAVRRLAAQAFLDPAGKLDGARRFAERAARQALARAGEAGQRGPEPAEPPVLPATMLPAAGVGEEALLALLDEALRACSNLGSPRYLGHMNPPPAVASIVGALASTVANNSMLSHETSRYFTELEVRLLGTFAEAFGLPPTAGGLFTSGGSLANIQALAVARNRAWSTDGRKATAIIASGAAHNSLEKAAMLLTGDAGNVRRVRPDERERLLPEDVEAALARLRAEAVRPLALVATCGTTVTGSVDPLKPLADLAAREGLWFHVDAAYGGAVAFSRERRALAEGIGRADSVTFNPQKWLYVANTSAMALFADRGQLERHFQVASPYVQRSASPNLGDVSLQGTRHPDAFKTFLTLQALGRECIEGLVDAGCRAAARLHAHLQARPLLQVAPPPQLNIVCFRMAGDADGTATRALRQFLGERGFFLSLPMHRGVPWLRAVLLNPFSWERELDLLVSEVDAFVAGAREPA